MSLRRLGFAALLLALLGALTSALFEIGVRVFAPQVLAQDVPDLWQQDEAIGWKHAPNAHVLANTGDRDVEICTDAAGDRVSCSESARSDCAGRILVMGDSYVEALAVPFESTVWRQLESDTGACTSVAGVSGWGPSQYLAAVRARLAEPGARFDLVILSLYLGNDLTDDAEKLPPAKDVQRRPFRLLPAGLSLEALVDWFYPCNAWLESRSHAYVALRFAIRRLRDPGDVGLYGAPRALRTSQLTRPYLDETARGVGLVAEAARARRAAAGGRDSRAQPGSRSERRAPAARAARARGRRGHGSRFARARAQARGSCRRGPRRGPSADLAREPGTRRLGRARRALLAARTPEVVRVDSRAGSRAAPRGLSGGSQAFADGRAETSPYQRVRFFCSGRMRISETRPKSIATSAVMSAIV